MRSVMTRFRAYQLGTAGSSFSYFAGGHFTMIEARLTDVSREQVEREMVGKCGVDRADVLHITSWDSDHCNKHELPDLLNLIQPRRIECPGYDPYKDRGHGEDCLETIAEYRDRLRNTVAVPVIRHITPQFIGGLEHASAKAFVDTYYNPLRISDNANDNSTVKLFRKGSFNVLSLGNVESPMIGARLRRQRILKSEVDVMILAHHRADNGFTTKKFLNHIEPRIAICSSNYGDMYDHPRQEIRDLLYEQDIHLKATKTGDVIRSTENHTGRYEVVNLIGKSTVESSRVKGLIAKKSGILAANGDALRQRYGPRRSWPR